MHLSKEKKKFFFFGFGATMCHVQKYLFLLIWKLKEKINVAGMLFPGGFGGWEGVSKNEKM